jgi:hypothetical protein
MYRDKIFFLCPHLDVNPEGIICDAAKDFIKTIKDINIKTCMSRHFESCNIYFLSLKEMRAIPVSPKNGDRKY